MENIARLRRMHGLTQTQLGKMIGVSTSTIAMWETGRRKPDYHMIKRMCEYFAVSFAELTGEETAHDSPTENRKIPVVGYVRAGIPATAVESIIGYENVNDELCRAGEIFGLKIRGNSMEPKMSEGDVVIVRRQSEARSGQVAVVMAGKEDATVKKVYFQNDGITLIPINPEYTPIHYTKQECENLPVTIVGVVVELRCRYE